MGNDIAEEDTTTHILCIYVAFWGESVLIRVLGHLLILLIKNGTGNCIHAQGKYACLALDS